jgi:hypothetical protein
VLPAYIQNGERLIEKQGCGNNTAKVNDFISHFLGHPVFLTGF